jgi:hypothetical protein
MVRMVNKSGGVLWVCCGGGGGGGGCTGMGFGEGSCAEIETSVCAGFV